MESSIEMVVEVVLVVVVQETKQYRHLVFLFVLDVCVTFLYSISI